MAKPGIVPRVLDWLADKWEDFPALMILIGMIVVGVVVLLILVPASLPHILWTFGGIVVFCVFIRAMFEVFDHIG